MYKKRPKISGLFVNYGNQNKATCDLWGLQINYKYLYDFDYMYTVCFRRKYFCGGLVED